MASGTGRGDGLVARLLEAVDHADRGVSWLDSSWGLGGARKLV